MDRFHVEDTDEVTVIVVTNRAPVADAGTDQLLSVGDVVLLDGSLSIDPYSDSENATFLYNWTVITQPSSALELSDSAAVQPTFSASDPGFYSFGLAVSDGDLTSITDTVTVRALKSFPELGGMIHVPAGDFIMGRADSNDLEGPPHRVELSSYWIDKYEVSAGAYQACVDDGVCSAAAMISGCNTGDNNRTDHPANCVSWDQSRAYCSWQGKRLPTEAEWERAARGEDERLLPWGTRPPSSDLLNFNNNVGSTTPIDSYPFGVSFYGLHNMMGNVAEWTSDYFDQDFYSQSPTKDPQGPIDGNMRTRRGFSFMATAIGNLRLTMRGYSWPDHRINAGFGFRCASNQAHE